MADDDNLLVTISGPAFSMMLYENARIHDQIGFLLGEILMYVSTRVTDSDKDEEQSKLHINIKNVVSYPQGEPFFNSAGEIEEETVNAILGPRLKNVVGWYHYRQNFRLDTSLRDINIHNHLLKLVSKNNGYINKENFMLCLLNSSVNETGGTHKFKHLLLHKPKNGFIAIPLKITNLGADATRPDGSDHRPVPKDASSDSDVFDKVYECTKYERARVSGVQSVTLIEKAAENLLDTLSPEISKTDKEVSRLEQEIIKLRNQIYKAKFEKLNESFVLLEEQMQKMEVDFKSSIRPSRRSSTPEIYVDSKRRSSSPEIYDDLRTQMPSTSSAAMRSPLNIMHDGSGNRSVRDRNSSERESQDFTLTTFSPASDSSRVQDSPKSPTLF